MGRPRCSQNKKKKLSSTSVGSDALDSVQGCLGFNIGGARVYFTVHARITYTTLVVVRVASASIESSETETSHTGVGMWEIIRGICNEM